MRLSRWLPVSILAFITYIIFSGSTSLYDVVTGIIVASITGWMFANITLTNPRKLLQPKRWIMGVVYAVRYFVVDETKAHLDVIKRILHPRTPVSPAIVAVPFEVESDYAITAIANSITNTPGTVVVDVDKDKKVFYVHWINATTLEPAGARENISSVFEKYSKAVFE